MASKWDNLPPGGIVIDSDGRTTIVQYVPDDEQEAPADDQEEHPIQSIDITEIKQGQLAELDATRPTPSPELRAAINQIVNRKKNQR